jgi:protein-disulfide isomerase
MKNTIVYAFSIIVAGALIAGALYYRAPSQPAAVVTPTPDSGPTVVLNIDKDDSVLGNPDAPITVINFSDFQCPFCGRHVTTTEKQIVDKYVKTGKVKLVFRNFAFLGQESVWAGAAVECAKEQDKFWQMHDYLFSHQNDENQGAFSKDNLKKLAADAGLDTAKFNVCFDSGKYEAKVQSSAQESSKYGVISTPTTFIGKMPITIPDSVLKSLKNQDRAYDYDLKDGAELIIGAQPYSTFEETIEKLLK